MIGPRARRMRRTLPLVSDTCRWTWELKWLLSLELLLTWSNSWLARTMHGGFWIRQNHQYWLNFDVSLRPVRQAINQGRSRLAARPLVEAFASGLV